MQQMENARNTLIVGWLRTRTNTAWGDLTITVCNTANINYLVCATDLDGAESLAQGPCSLFTMFNTLSTSLLATESSRLRADVISLSHVNSSSLVFKSASAQIIYKKPSGMRSI